MAKTLNEFKKEFEAITKTYPKLSDLIKSNDHNLDQHRQMLNDHFEQLGPRIHELRDGGVQGTKIENFMHDREIAIMIKELANRRETAKLTAKKNQELIEKQLKPLNQRLKKLQTDLQAEIKTRKGKFSSAKLGINQSVKEMEPLLAQVDKFIKSDKNYEWAVNYQGTYPPAQFDRLYNLMLDKELSKSKAVVLNAFQQMMQTQMLNVKNLQKGFTQARTFFETVSKAAETGKTAHAARDVPGLSRAKQDAAAALQKLKDVVEPYEKALADPKIRDMVDHSQDKGKIEQGVQNMAKMLDKAEGLEDELNSRRMV